jgi:hypothetical protein
MDAERSLRNDPASGGTYRRAMATTDPVHLEPSSSLLRAPEFRETLPLLLASATLFVAGFACWKVGIDAGPPRFPLWALLLLLGFVAAIGSVLSWLLAGSSTGSAESRPVPLDLRNDATDEPGEFGRPAPDVRRPSSPHESAYAARAPWDEGPVDEERSLPRPTPTRTSAATAAPVSTATVGPKTPGPTAPPGPPPNYPKLRIRSTAETESAIRELEGIQQEIVPRRKRTERGN